MSHATDKFVFLLKGWLHEQAARINPGAVIKDILSEVEITAGYFFILTIANLIALCGLLMNSSPVIIGAMLVSPLMGPILSSGFAFVTGDNVIWSKSVRKISLSVALSIVVAAAATYVSPLKDVTNEILSRTRPNLYDLIIAFLAGVAGASALCTKKNYLTIVPGVAIATAVIPPLSVAGFGAGIANLRIFYGGFLLFFTNFVAIVLSTCAVFSFYGFRRKMAAVELSQMKKRFAFLIVVLVVISIPLVYTLHTSLAEVRQRTAIQDALQQALEREKRTHLTTFTYVVDGNGSLEISAQVNTVRYLSDAEITAAERSLDRVLGRKIILNVEQVKVQAGGLKQEIAKPAMPAIAPQKPPGEILRSSGQSVIAVVRQSAAKVDGVIAPSRISDFSVGFSDKSPDVAILLKIRRDTPLSAEQIDWIRRMLVSDLHLPVDLRVETVPFVPPLVFRPNEELLSADMKQQILVIGEIYRQDPAITLRVEASVDRAGRTEKLRAGKRLEQVVEVLVKECGVPRERIRTVMGPKSPQPTVRITVLTGQPAAGS